MLWRAVWNGRKRTKPPFQTSGWNASHSNPSHWDSFEQVCRIFGKGSWDGMLYVLTPEDGLTGIDLDHCCNPKTGHIAAWAQVIIDRFPSYCERSPSGTGIRIFVLGKLPGTGHKIGKLGPKGDGALEIYDRNRALSLTGHRLKGCSPTIKSRQRAINALSKEHYGWLNPPPVAVVTDVNARTSLLSDSEVLDVALAASNGAAFHSLYYKGDLSPYGGDHSSADLALVGALAFYCGGDAEQIERLFDASALCRDKWLDREDYRRRTIAAAMNGRTQFFETDHWIKSLFRMGSGR